MKKILFFSFNILLLCVACNTTKKTVKPKEFADFSIVFIQDDKRMKAADGIQLHKRPFTIETSVFYGDNLFVHAQLGDNAQFLGDEFSIDWSAVPAQVMAEPSFNEEKELMLSNDYFCNWFYDANMDWHRFNSVKTLPNGGFVGTKEISRFFLEKSRKPRPLEEAGKPLYLFFFTMDGDYESGYSLRQHQYIKVEWR